MPDPTTPPPAAAPTDHDNHPDVSKLNSRNALILFAIYLALYGGFVFLSATSPKSMGFIVFAGINLAVVYGFALIFAAVLLAIIYMWLCARVMTQYKLTLTQNSQNPGDRP